MASFGSFNAAVCNLQNLNRLSSLSSLNFRCYAQATARSQGWSSVFNPDLNKHKAVKRFKENLFRDVENCCSPVAGSLEFKALNCLIDNNSNRDDFRKNPLMTLYNLILQRRIKDDDIYKVISTVKNTSVINVSVPKYETTKKVGSKSQRLYQPFLKIHPEEVDHLGNVIQASIHDEKSSNYLNSPQFKGLHAATVTDTVPAEKLDIDIKSLRKFLEKAEIETKQRRHYAWENQKRYNWEQRLANAQQPSPGKLLFGSGAESFTRSRQGFFKSLFTNTRLGTPFNLDSEPKELLIYNLEAKSKHYIPPGNDNSIFNINYKDLFGVINKCGFPPDETLSLIKNFETQGWKLVGDLYDNSKSLVFQRASSKRGAQKIASVNFNALLWTSLFLILGYGTFQFHEKKG